MEGRAHGNADTCLVVRQAQLKSGRYAGRQSFAGPPPLFAIAIAAIAIAEHLVEQLVLPRIEGRVHLRERVLLLLIVLAAVACLELLGVLFDLLADPVLDSAH